MWPGPWSLWRQWDGASKQRRCSFECVGAFANVCLVLCCPPVSRSRASCLVSPEIQHSTIIDPSLQLTARFVPNQFLSPSSVPLSVYLSLSLCIPLSSFFTLPPCVPHCPPPSHASTSHPKVSEVTPSKVIRKQQLAEKSILYQQATTGFCTYPIWSLW